MGIVTDYVIPMVWIVFLKGHDEDVRGIRTHVDRRLSDARQIATGVPSYLIRKLLLGAISNAVLYHAALGGGLSHCSCTEYEQCLPAGLGCITAVFYPDIHFAFDYGIIDVTIDVTYCTGLGRLRTVVLLGVGGTDFTQYFPKG